MLAGLATWVIVGHSERRRDAGETDELIGRKLGAGASTPACGRSCASASSSRSARPGRRGRRRRRRSCAGALDGRDPARAGRGRAWSSPTSRSGRSGPAATPAARTPRRWPTRSGRRSPALGWGDGADDVPVLYGGSVTSANIGEFLAEPAIDGALVGGASLKPDEMAGIVARAGLTAAARGAAGVTGRARPAGRRPRPIVLVVLDGFGIGRDPAADAIAAAPMPAWRGLLARWPHAVLGASEDAVGLPPGQMGNSEVGHLNLGAGRPVLQDLPRIDAAIADGSFFERPALARRPARRAATAGGALHLVSLDRAGRRPRQRPAPRRARRAGRARRASPTVRVHALLDGRDTPPRSALGFVARPRGAARGGPPGRARSRRSAAATRDGPRPALGPRRARLRRDRPRGGRARRVGDRGDRGRPTPAARPTSSSRRP